VYEKEFNNWLYLLNQSNSIVETCPPGKRNCGDNINSLTLSMWERLGNFNEETVSTFRVYWNNACPTVQGESPDPYIKNKTVEACMKSSTSATTLASKSLHDQIKTALESPDAKTCNRVRLGKNEDGSPKQETVQVDCVNMDHSSNVPRCYFEVKSSFDFSLEWNCFNQTLWPTWLKFVFNLREIMEEKGYQMKMYMNRDHLMAGKPMDKSWSTLSKDDENWANYDRWRTREQRENYYRKYNSDPTELHGEKQSMVQHPLSEISAITCAMTKGVFTDRLNEITSYKHTYSWNRFRRHGGPNYRCGMYTASADYWSPYFYIFTCRKGLVCRS